MKKDQAMGVLRCARVLGVLVVLAGCGDAATTDRRGYTKAPLERPGLFIKAEPRTAMDELGDPVLQTGGARQPPAQAAASTQSAGQ